MKIPRRKRLKNLQLDRVDLVTAGANPGAFVMIHKFDEVLQPNDSEADTVKSEKSAEAPDAQPQESEVADVEKGSRWYLPGDPVADGSRWYLPLEDGSRWYMPDAPLQDGSRWYVPGPVDAGSRWYAPADVSEGSRWYLPEHMEPVHDGSRWYLAAKSAEPPAVDDVEKADLRKALEDARAEVAKMQQDRKQAEFVAKAAEYANLGKADELGGLLLAANEAFSTDQYQALERLLKAANAQIDKGDLFAQFSQPDAEPGDAMDRINTLAKAKVDAGEAKTLEIAKLQVMQQHPELQSEYMSARDSAR